MNALFNGCPLSCTMDTSHIYSLSFSSDLVHDRGACVPGRSLRGPSRRCIHLRRLRWQVRSEKGSLTCSCTHGMVGWIGSGVPHHAWDIVWNCYDRGCYKRKVSCIFTYAIELMLACWARRTPHRRWSFRPDRRNIYYIKKEADGTWIPGTIVSDRSVKVISFAETIKVRRTVVPTTAGVEHLA